LRLSTDPSIPYWILGYNTNSEILGHFLQTNQRVFAIEVVHHLAEECSVVNNRNEEFQGSNLTWKILIEGIIDRALDKISFIRVKAINCLASMLLFINKNGYENPIGKAMEATVGSETSMDSQDLKQKIVLLAINRSRDSKPTVRKAALSLLEQSLLLCDGIDSKSMKAITSASHDTFVSVRKQSATTVSSLFNAFSGKENVCRMWLQVILPLCLDTEVSIQTACKDYFQKEFLDSLARGKCQEFISFIACESNFALLLRKVMGVTKLTHSQLARVAKALQNAIRGLDDPAAETGFWIILSEVVAKYPSLLDSGFIHAALKNLDAYLSEGRTLARVMQTISNSAKKMNHEFCLEACSVLTDKLKTFSVPIEAISYCLSALHEVSKVVNSTSTATASMNYLSTVATSAEQLFKDCMARKNLAGSESNLACALYTMGDLSLLKSFQISSGVVSLVQSMTSDRLLGLDVKIPQTVQAHSWACLGKFCLKNEDLAKKMIPLFFHEIKKTRISAVRNNIMLILADLCTKYTSLVDVHIGEIAECFDDPSEVVRRQTLIVLATLLQQDFLKWRGPIFHCFLLSLVDDSKTVQSLGSFLLSTSLSQKASQLAYNFFVQTLFALNGHSSHTNLAMKVEAESLVRTNLKDLAGSDDTNRQKRCIIYHHLLKRMSPEHKFQIAAKICEDCISPLVDNNLDFDSHIEVLRDSLVVLASKEMKVHVSVQSSEVEEDQNLAFAAAKGKVISAMMKKHLVDTIVPLVIELKRILEAQKSPLLGILLNFACAVLKEYKEEIEEILVADNTFAKEVLYEIQQENNSRQPLIHGHESAPNSPILKGNSFATPIAPQTVARSPLPVGTSSKTPLAAEVLQDEGMMTAKSVKKNSEKKYLESARLLHPVGENTPAGNAQVPASKEKGDDKNNNNEVRRLSSLFNAAAD
jgi:condensin-2 complex subunit D3